LLPGLTAAVRGAIPHVKAGLADGRGDTNITGELPSPRPSVRGGAVTEHPHEEVFKRTYEAFTAGDLEALAELFANDVVWHTPGRNPLSGDYEGRDATFASFTREFELSGGTYAVQLHDVLADDDHTVRCFAALQSATARPWT
jgi:uncharacterized protein